MVYITTADKESASKLAQKALEKKLAGCANIISIHSLYPWQSIMQNEDEVVLILKTVVGLKTKLRDFITLHHTYEIPCIMSWDVEVNNAYADWIKQNVDESTSI